jgi:hypothetical protein
VHVRGLPLAGAGRDERGRGVSLLCRWFGHRWGDPVKVTPWFAGCETHEYTCRRCGEREACTSFPLFTLALPDSTGEHREP